MKTLIAYEGIKTATYWDVLAGGTLIPIESWAWNGT